MSLGNGSGVRLDITGRLVCCLYNSFPPAMWSGQLLVPGLDKLHTLFCRFVTMSPLPTIPALTHV